MLTASDRQLEIPFPNGNWSISGLVLKHLGGERPFAVPPAPDRLPRPSIRHEAPGDATVGKDLPLMLAIESAAHVNKVRLYYRPLDQLTTFKVIEHAPGEPFIVPAADIPSNYDLMYYFEVITDNGCGWFQPDPVSATPTGVQIRRFNT